MWRVRRRYDSYALTPPPEIAATTPPRRYALMGEIPYALTGSHWVVPVSLRPPKLP